MTTLAKTSDLLVPLEPQTSVTTAQTTASDLPTLIPITDLPSLPRAAQTETLDTIFEPTLELHDIALPLLQTTPPSYSALIESIRSELLGLALKVRGSGDGSAAVGGEVEVAKKTLEGILGAHPRLGAKKVDSALSRMEQARMAAASGMVQEGAPGPGVNISSTLDSSAQSQEQQQQQQQEEESTKLRALNEEYEKKFPGLRYVVFVNGRPRSVIMQDMKSRIQRGDIDAEREEGVNAMCDIAQDRCKKLEVS